MKTSLVLLPAVFCGLSVMADSPPGPDTGFHTEADMEKVSRVRGEGASDASEDGIQPSAAPFSARRFERNGYTAGDLNGVPPYLADVALLSRADVDGALEVIARHLGFQGSESLVFGNMSRGSTEVAYHYWQYINGLFVYEAAPLQIYIDPRSGELLRMNGRMQLDPGNLPVAMPFSAEIAAQLIIDSGVSGKEIAALSRRDPAFQAQLAYKAGDRPLELIWAVGVGTKDAPGAFFYVHADGSVQIAGSSTDD